LSVFVVDASVGAKWWFPEEHHDAAVRLRNPAHELHVPDLFDVEVCSVVCKRVRRKEITPAEGKRVFDQLERVPLRRHTDRKLLQLSFEIATATTRALYDCHYLALALTLEARMVTADDRFYQALRHSPLSEHLMWVEEIP